MKTLVKRAVAHSLRAVAPLGAAVSDPIAILTYHSVGGSAPGSQPTRLFRAQVEWLANHGAEFPVVPLKTAFSTSPRVNGTKVLITFDDGYCDNAEIAAPILEQFGLPATFFVSSAFIDGDRQIVADFRNYRGLPNMTWEQVRRLAERGHEIGLHGHRHASYGALSKAEAEADLRRSYELTYMRTGSKPASFAYAFGQRRDQRDDLTPTFQSLGIRYVFTSIHKRASAGSLERCADLRLPIPRLRVDPDDSLAIFIEKLQGLWDWIAVVQGLDLVPVVA